MSSRNDIIDLNKLYVDRVWVKAYPEFFKDLRNNWDIYRRYRKEGIFQDMTDSFFRVYRTINGLKIAFRKNQAVSSVDDLRQLLKFGEREEESFERFLYFPDGTIEVGRLKLTKEQILSSELKTYTRVVDEKKGKIAKEEVFYIVLSPWLRIAVKPFLSGFYPHMIRFFLNGIIFAKEGVKFDSSPYEFHSENWIDPYGYDFEGFMRMQEYFLKFVRENIPKMARDLWMGFFGREEDLEVKVTQVELAYDSYIEKMRLVNALRLIAGSHKTLKYDVAQRKEDMVASWGNDIGIKYYVTVKRGLQLKAYSKAIHKVSGKILNRFEITLGLNRSIFEMGEKDFFSQRVIGDVKKMVQKVNIGLADTETIEEIKKVLRQFVKAKKPEYRPLYEAFLLDLFIHGQVKGKGMYRKIAQIYAREGLIEIQGRGRNSVYVLKPEFLLFHENLKKIFGDIPCKLLKTPAETTQ
jgi:hypothetical protein